MVVHFGLDLLQPEWKHCVACIGTFDGVHLGHRALIERCIHEAAPFEYPAVVITFDRHPASVVRPDAVPPAISTLSQNLEQFQKIGADVACVVPFDQALSQTTATSFLEEVLLKKLRVARLVIGHDFAFGKGREGTPQWLSSRIPTTVVEPIEQAGVRVSSSAIRKAIEIGEVGRAHKLMGRPYRMDGVVVSGQKLGRTIGYPTINLARTSNQMVTANGVYAGQAITPRGNFKAAISIGARPAVGGNTRTIEAYLLDYPGDSLYGDAVGLELWVRLRNEEDFPSLEALIAQIDRDVEITKAIPAPVWID